MSTQRIIFDFIRSCALKMGVSISWYPPPHSFERHLRDYLAQMRINCVLDVGAFVGEYAVQLRRNGYMGSIVSFEPVPASYALLRQRMQHDALWRGQPFGLSDTSGEALMHTGSFNSLLNLHADAEQAYKLDPHLRSEIPIQLRRLEEVLPELIKDLDSPRIFMKMDTQGHDVSVLRGVSTTLDKIVGFQSELPTVQIYDGMPSMSEALAYYRTSGYVPIGFYPVNTFRDMQVSAEFDVLFNRFDGSLARARQSTQVGD